MATKKAVKKKRANKTKGAKPKVDWRRRLMIVGAGLAGAGVLAWLLTWPDLPPAVANAIPEVQVAAVPADKNAFLVYQAAGKLVQFPHRVGKVEGRPAKPALMTGLSNWDPALRPAVVAFVADNGPALERMRDGRRVSGFQVSEPGHDLQSRLPSYVSLQDLSRLATADMRLALEAGRHGTAFQRAIDILNLGRRMTYAYNDPMITELVGAVISGLALEGLTGEWAAVAKAPTPVLETFLRDLNTLDRLERPIGQYLLGERDSAIRSAPLLARGTDTPIAKFLMAQPVIDRYTSYSRNVFDLQMQKAEARDWKGQRELIERYTRIGPKEMASFPLHPADAVVRILSTIALPSFTGAAEKILTGEARYDALRIRVATELYRRSHGQSPSDLGALKAVGLSAVPVDPFKPQQSLAFAEGRLWSVGRDGLDQQGQKAQPEKPIKDGVGDLIL